jgi:hypothetical protein
MFKGVPENEMRKMTCENVAREFRFDLSKMA